MVYSEDDISKFWAKVKRLGADDCWPWVGTKMLGGYGLFDRNRGGNRKAVRAHRLAFLLSGGCIPEGMMLRHKCDNRICCNPSHLIPGTAKENSSDMVSRGRHWTQQRPQDVPRGANHWVARRGPGPLVRGSKHHNSKLTESKVAKIRKLYQTGEWSQRGLAAKFSVSQGTIWQIIAGNRWKS